MNIIYILLKNRLFLSAIVLSLSIMSAYAHEPRTIGGGSLNVAVGWDVEPAFEKQMNAFELVVTDAVDVDDPDLNVTILYLKSDAQDAEIIAMEKLSGDLRRSRSNPNQFNISILPTKAGAYGFHIEGLINGAMIDETFICRGGSLNPDGRSFGCVDKLQKFPGSKKSHRDDHD